MKVWLKTTAEQEFDGICPACKEHTTAGDSCCGRGAYIEGGRVSDEEAEEIKANPQVSVVLLRNVPIEKARAVQKALSEAGAYGAMISAPAGLGINEDKWELRLFVDVGALPVEVIK
jgi:hypothetical protein